MGEEASSDPLSASGSPSGAVTHADIRRFLTGAYQRCAADSSANFAVICSDVRRASASSDDRISRTTPTPELTIADVATVPATAPPATKKPAPGKREPSATVSN